jgi:predicted GNAT family acetyltransferase
MILCWSRRCRPLGEHDRVALFADYWNAGAIATYTRLGFGLRPPAAAKVGG